MSIPLRLGRRRRRHRLVEYVPGNAFRNTFKVVVDWRARRTRIVSYLLYGNARDVLRRPKHSENKRECHCPFRAKPYPFQRFARSL